MTVLSWAEKLTPSSRQPRHALAAGLSVAPRQQPPHEADSGGTRRWRLLVAVAALVPGLVFALLSGSRVWVLLGLVAWFVVTAARGLDLREVTLREQWSADLKQGGVLCAAAACAAVLGLLTLPEARVVFATAALVSVGTMAMRLMQPRHAKTRSVVLLGGRAEVEAFVTTAGAGDEVIESCHFVDPPALSSQEESAKRTTRVLAEVLESVSKARADDVLVLPGAAVDSDLVRRLTWVFENSWVNLGIVHPLAAVAPHRLRTRVNAQRTVVELRTTRAVALARAAKHVLDRVAAGCLLLCVAPVIAALWLLVRLESPGAGFFVQTRVGRDGKLFRMVKLRSMRLDAEHLLAELAAENEVDGPLFKIQRDPRITRVGRWLRRSSLDELPQLVNVVLGDMSLVGPRPALPAEVAEYDEVARRRLVVKPGITGLWQVSGRSNLSWDESIQLDLYYADNWRLRDDFFIAARTVGAVMAARGAY